MTTLPDAATRGALCKKMFLQICQNSQENTCTRVSFLVKLQACGTFFTEHHKATASILREGKRLNQIEISIISKLDKENNNNNNNKRKCSYIFDFLIVALILSLYYIILYSLCSNMLNLENVLE